MVKKRFLLTTFMIFGLWTLLVLYPNPYRLILSAYRMVSPATNPVVMEKWLEISPSDPREIEEFVLERIPYQYDWQTYGMPFYFPTVEEAMEKGTGDCKGRFVVLASLFEAKGIPYRQSFSFSHFWVDYEGKEDSSVEDTKNAFLLRTEEGTKIQLPREDLRDSYRVLKEGFWDYMPTHRKFLFLLGFPLAIIGGFLNRRTKVIRP